MSYEKVQFIGHAINVAPHYDPESGKGHYVGKADAKEDIAARLSFVKALLGIAHLHAARDADTLKVLMLPEFYFRGHRGVYTLKEAHKVIAGLQALVRDETWRHWFFVFGSVMAHSHADGANALEEAEIYNIVPCQIGGYLGEAADDARVVMKQRESNLDFVREAAAGKPDLFVWEHVHDLQPLKRDGAEVIAVNYDGEGVFDACGFKWGLEVCLDHARHRLQHTPDLPDLAFQLIPSCGMTISDADIVLRRGWAFNVDGNYKGRSSAIASKNERAHTELLKVTPEARKPAPKPDCIALDELDADELYALKAGELHVYAPVDARPT